MKIRFVIAVIICLSIGVLNAQMNNGIWEQVDIDIPNLSISSIAVNASGVVLVIGHENNGRGNSVLLRSTDEGESWTVLSPKNSKGNPMFYQNGLFLEAVGNRFYYGWRKYMTSHYSDDNGSNWTWIKEENLRSTAGYFGSQNRIEYSLPVPTLFQRNSVNLGKWDKKGEVKIKKRNSWGANIDWIKVGLYGGYVAGINGNAYSEFTRTRTAFYNILTGINGYIYSTDKIGGKIYGNRPLSFSNDNGVTWNEIESAKFGVLDIFRTCNSDELFVSAKDGFRPFIAHTRDGGKTWKDIAIPDMIEKGQFGGNIYPKIKKLEFSPKGTGYLVISLGDFVVDGTRKLYRKANLASCQGMAETPSIPDVAVNYGTTIITHGFQLGGKASVNPGEWAYDMGKSILQKIDNKGCIKRYNKKTGYFDTVRGNCNEGETILLFDWAEESDDEAHGYSEAAGDALFSALILGQKKGDLDLTDLHFIGHSRGTVVSSECVLRLLTIGIAIDHVTYLDPHDWGVNGGLSRMVDDFDVHPEFPPIQGIANSHQAVVGWEGVNFTDTYFQDAGFEFKFGDCGSCVGGLEGRAVDGSDSELWNYYGQNKLCHSNIHSCGYTESISSPNLVKDKKGGYKYSRIIGSSRPTIKEDNKIERNFKFFNSLEYVENGVQKNRIKGILNGSFDRVNSRNFAPGWVEHGGGKSSYPPHIVTFQEGYASLGYAPNEKEPAFLRHNRCYIPNTAKSIVFKAQTYNLKKGELNVDIIDPINQKRTSVEPIKIESELTDFAEFSFSVKDFQDSVIMFEFKFRGVPINVDLFPTLMISEVRLDENSTTELSHISELNQSVNRGTNKQGKPENDDNLNKTSTSSLSSIINDNQLNNSQGKKLKTNEPNTSNRGGKQFSEEDDDIEETEDDFDEEEVNLESVFLDKEKFSKREKTSEGGIERGENYSEGSFGDIFFDREHILMNFNTGYRIAQGTHFDLNFGSIVNEDKNIFLGIGFLHHSFDGAQQSMIGLYASTKVSLGYSFLTGDEFESDASLYFIGDFGYSNTFDGSAELKGGFFTNIGLGYPLYIYKNAYLDSGITWRRLSGKKDSANGYIKNVFNTVDLRVGIAVYLGR